MLRLSSLLHFYTNQDPTHRELCFGCWGSLLANKDNPLHRFPQANLHSPLLKSIRLVCLFFPILPECYRAGAGLEIYMTN